MKIKIVTAIAALLVSSQAAFLPRDRILQSVTPTPAPTPTPTPTPPPAPTPPPTPAYISTTKSLSYYGSNITVPFSAKLGCGACINSGYTYCIQGSMWTDYSGKQIN